jgi:hypothetical protein
MEERQVLIQQFQALRSEIDGAKARMFRIAVLGALGIPVLIYLAEKPDAGFLAPILPFAVLVLSMLFMHEQHSLMRCGRYMRERIEPLIEEGAGWEAWLESQPYLRVMDKTVFWCFLLASFVFYFSAVGLAISKLLDSGDAVIPGQYKVYVGGAIYALTAFWMAITVLHYWRYCTSTMTR